MYCTACGNLLNERDRFCPQCGKSVSALGEARAPRPSRLVRTMRDKKIAGVCGGVAQYFGIDSTLVRFLALALFLAFGTGAVVYLVGWIVMPKDTEVIATA
jgi:phage shock protein C